jgi:hypothetical protein
MAGLLPVISFPVAVAVVTGDYGFLGPTGGRFLAPIEPPVAGSVAISNRAELEAVASNLGGTYHLTADIDLSGANWVPIGTNSTNSNASRFTGTFDGQGYIIRNMRITGSREFSGLFGSLSGATIKNIGLEGTHINTTYLFNSTAFAGGINGNAIGIINISNCYNTGTITVSNGSFARVGGISGTLSLGSNISNCYNTGNVTSSDVAGGISGWGNATINNCYNTGNISGGSGGSGGICGVGLSINNCYNTGTVSSNGAAGGISGSFFTSDSGSISNCYNVGSVSSGTSAGGILGFRRANGATIYTISNSYWNSETSQVSRGVGSGTDAIMPLTSAQMRQQASFEGFDFGTVWGFIDGVNNGYPVLLAAGGSITLEVQAVTSKRENHVWGYAPPGTSVSIFVNDTGSPVVSVANALGRYSVNISLAGSGVNIIKAKAIVDGHDVSDSKAVYFDPTFPALVEFNAFSDSRANLLRWWQDGGLDILWHQPGLPFTFEVRIECPPQIQSIIEVYLVSEWEGIERKIKAEYDPVRGVWVAIDENPDLNYYVSGKLWVECIWIDNEKPLDSLSLGIGKPDRPSQLLMGDGVNALAFLPGNNSANGLPKINPNSGTHNLAPGLTVTTASGSEQWVIEVSDEAIGVSYVLWAHGNNMGEYIFVKFEKTGNYSIGNSNGMNHLALIKYAESKPRSGIIGYGGGGYLTRYFPPPEPRPVFRIAIDPAGYVYEAVPSNRLQGVKTTVYHTNNGMATGSPVMWNAVDFEQINPLHTNREGRYSWDVPPGWWQVKAELAGYETAYSGWMPVPPPQLEVNIGMVNRTAPIVERVSGYPDGIEIAFSRYMQLDGLTPANFTVMQDGITIPGTIELINAEWNYDTKTNEYTPQVLVSERRQYVSVLRFIPAGGQKLAGTVQFDISNNVRSYADVAMSLPFSRAVTIQPEPKTITAANMNLEYGKSGFIVVDIDPAEAAVGKKVLAVSGNPNIVSVSDAVVDASGRAAIPVTGNLPGKSQIILMLQDTLLQTEVVVSVGMPAPGHIQKPNGGNGGGNNDGIQRGIDYEITDLIVPGTTEGFSINLTQETIAIPASYSVVTFSIDGGQKWRAVRADTFSAARFPRLFNKDLTLHISDKPINRATKKPEEGAAIVTFPRINKRPAAPRLAVNYALDADTTGRTPGHWLLTDRGGTTARRGSDIQIGLASGRMVDEKGFGQFFEAPNHGIPVLALEGARPVRTVYFVRLAPKPDGAAFVPASKSARIRVSSELRAPRVRINAREARTNGDGSIRTPATESIKLRNGDFIFAGVAENVGGVPINVNGTTAAVAAGQTLHITANKGATVSIIDTPGSMTVWKAATARSPATAKQVINR